ncbi:MAG: hypothetical protein GY821_16330 [Gammaproteobacteria bacterium]|nr:hypothetical protein [Gammaproteobacteria bacterium]
MPNSKNGYEIRNSTINSLSRYDGIEIFDSLYDELISNNDGDELIVEMGYITEMARINKKYMRRLFKRFDNLDNEFADSNDGGKAKNRARERILGVISNASLLSLDTKVRDYGVKSLLQRSSKQDENADAIKEMFIKFSKEKPQYVMPLLTSFNDLSDDPDISREIDEASADIMINGPVFYGRALNISNVVNSNSSMIPMISRSSSEVDKRRVDDSEIVSRAAKYKPGKVLIKMFEIDSQVDHDDVIKDIENKVLSSGDDHEEDAIYKLEREINRKNIDNIDNADRYIDSLVATILVLNCKKIDPKIKQGLANGANSYRGADPYVDKLINAAKKDKFAIKAIKGMKELAYLFCKNGNHNEFQEESIINCLLGEKQGMARTGLGSNKVAVRKEALTVLSGMVKNNALNSKSTALKARVVDALLVGLWINNAYLINHTHRKKLKKLH